MNLHTTDVSRGSAITCPRCGRPLATRPAGGWLIAPDLGRAGIAYQRGRLRLRCPACLVWTEQDVTPSPGRRT